MLDPESKQWLDYVSKLNDRALQRQRASGITTWAIAGVVAWLFFNEVLTNVSALANDVVAQSIHVLALTVILDLLFWGSHQLLLYWGIWGDLFNEVRFQSKFSETYQRVFAATAISVRLILACLNLYSTGLAPRYGLFAWPFWLAATILVIEGGFGLFSGLFKKQQYNLRVPQLPADVHGPLGIRVLKSTNWLVLLVSGSSRS